MSIETIAGFYFLVGVVYCFINGAVRNIDPDDYLLAFVWIVFWPICFLALIMDGIFKLFRK